VLKYFPDALCEVAALSKVGNDKHNAGQPLHWAKEKSQDEDDACVRHLLSIAKGEVFDESYPGKRIRHRAAVAWRALAGLQREIEAEQAAPAINPQPDVPAVTYHPLLCVWCVSARNNARARGADRMPALCDLCESSFSACRAAVVALK
jgi:hypothetical protein